MFGLLVIAVLLTAITTKKQNAAIKVFSFVLLLELVTELSASFLFPVVKIWLDISTNIPIYNCFILLAFIGYLTFFRLLIKAEWFRFFSVTICAIFFLLWLYATIFVFGIVNWNSYIHVALSLFTIIGCVTFLYELYYYTSVKKLTTYPEFWIICGLMIFYSGNLPLTGMLNLLIDFLGAKASYLGIFLIVLNIIMYSFIIYGYLCLIRKTK